MAEIERRIQVCQDYAKCNLTENTRIGNKAQQLELNDILSFINNLEVKEVNLDVEINLLVRNLHRVPNFEELNKFARHFFELGLKIK